MADSECKHERVTAIYLSAWGDLAVTINDLKISDPKITRPVMCVTRLICASCKKKLTKRDLGNRVELGGDLYDPRFRFQF